MSIRPNMITQLGPILHWWCWACPTLICKTTLQWRINSQYRTCYLGNTTVEERYEQQYISYPGNKLHHCDICMTPALGVLTCYYSLHLFLLLRSYKVWVGIGATWIRIELRVQTCLAATQLVYHKLWRSSSLPCMFLHVPQTKFKFNHNELSAGFLCLSVQS